MQSPSPRHRFALLASKPDEQIDLGEAALLIASEEYPGLDLHTYLGRLDQLAERVRGRLAAAKSGDRLAEAVGAVNAVLFGEVGLRGNQDDYYDPRNSYLNDVLERGLGIPITLSIVFIEVARRVRLDAVGIGLPGHFIVRCASGRGVEEASGDALYIDAFGGGALLNEEDCARLVAEVTGQQLPWNRAWLEPWPKKRILARVLANLKRAYTQRRDLQRALSAVDRILLLEPTAAELRDRGVLLTRLGHHMAAWYDFHSYLEAVPEAPDAAEIRELSDGIWRLLGRMN